MNERAEIQRLYERLAREGGPGVLATIVRTVGSTYRRPGARMLLASNGSSAGLISGGCLESDLRERATSVLATGEPAVVTYDSTQPDEILWGLGLGCPGVVQVLLERIVPGETCDVLEFVGRCARANEPGAIATIYEVAGGVGAGIGGRVMLDRGSVSVAESSDSVRADPVPIVGGSMSTGTIRDPELARQMRDACAEALRSEGSRHVRCGTPEGSADVFVEYLAPAPELVVLGAGPGAVPLVRIAKHLGWRVTLVDARQAFLTREAFPGADRLLRARPEETAEAVPLPPGCVAIVLTHNFEHDAAIVRALLASPARYIGLLGPKSKSRLLLERLREEGIEPSDEQIARLYNPVGLDIGSETPEEIALAVAAEILSVLRGRPAGPLRRREGPIHA